MTSSLTIGLAQLNPCVGALRDTYDLALQTVLKAGQSGCDLVVFSELFLTGYPPEDLILRPDFVQKSMQAVQDLAEATKNSPTGFVIGTPWYEEGKVYNAVVLIDQGEIQAIRFKHFLPNYGVFDEARLFEPGPLPQPVAFRGVKLGLPVCEDLWRPGPGRHLAEQGAEILISSNASPYRRGVEEERFLALKQRQEATDLPLLYVNQVGGQDELVFDGGSLVMNADGVLVRSLPRFETDFSVSRWTRYGGGWQCEEGERAPVMGTLEADYQAVVLGLRDYVQKNRFPGVILGLSGGIDSALVAALACDALGAERVHCVMMPTRYTSPASLEDGKACAEALGVSTDILDLEDVLPSVEGLLKPFFKNKPADITEENLQSRLRGLLLMALSNKTGAMVLTTGNKSELAVGYATLYGDMCGGYNPLKDLYKTEVYALARWRNAHKPKNSPGAAGSVLPKRILEKPPSAELRPDQTDQDSLPPYDILDGVLYGLIEEKASFEEMCARGYDAETVAFIEDRLYRTEFKRYQAAPGVKLSSCAFGRDWRYPLTHSFLNPKTT